MQPAPPTIRLGISTGGMHLINLIKNVIVIDIVKKVSTNYNVIMAHLY